MPPVMQSEDIPMVVYSLTETTRSKLLGKELDLEVFSNNSSWSNMNWIKTKDSVSFYYKEFGFINYVKSWPIFSAVKGI